MKSYTDKEQSKKLAEIMQVKSADMFYRSNGIDVKLMWEHNAQKVTTPCWSLSALLDVLPNNEHISTTISRGSWKVATAKYLSNIWWCQYEDTKTETEFNISADNPIDACYKMIIKLHKKGLL